MGRRTNDFETPCWPHTNEEVIKLMRGLWARDNSKPLREWQETKLADIQTALTITKEVLNPVLGEVNIGAANLYIDFVESLVKELRSASFETVVERR